MITLLSSHISKQVGGNGIHAVHIPSHNIAVVVNPGTTTNIMRIFVSHSQILQNHKPYQSRKWYWNIDTIGIASWHSKFSWKIFKIGDNSEI